MAPPSMTDANVPDAGTCAASAMFCGSDSAVYSCNSDGTGASKIQDCEHGCANGACNPCAPGSTFCNGAGLSTCDASGNIAGTNLCMGHGCLMDRCNTCTPGEHFCASGSAITCNSDGTPGASAACGANGCAGGVCNACTPSTTTCQGDTLVACSAGGTVASTTQCALGCSTSPSPRCRELVPSFGAGPPSGVGAFDLVIGNTATLDISNCTATPNVVTLTIGATTTSLVGAPRIAVVAQSGAPPICVVRYHNVTVEVGGVLTIENSSAVGQALALEAEGTMSIHGTIAFRNRAPGSAKGANTTAAMDPNTGAYVAAGAGGAGAAWAGGQGGACTSPACSTFAGGLGGPILNPGKLLVGSKGGDVFSFGTQVGFGGLGGGGLQLVALASIAVGSTGRIDLNGLGGTGWSPTCGQLCIFGGAGPAGGGGAGGTLVIETPSLSISQGATVAANGGGGAGGCYTCVFRLGCSHANGQQGQLSASRATGGSCANGGNGGFASNGVANPSSDGQNADSGELSTGGGGGGGDGFIVLRARDAAHRVLASGSVISPSPTLSNVATN